MDFGTLLHMAKKNNEISKDSNKFYNTKFAPPKKESKEKKLSDNIQKFLQKREQEERERQREHREKVAKLLAMRDEKSKNKIRKMLKVTKSANKSVLEDAINEEHTAITLQGSEQPDVDDYGYTSMEANAFYQTYMEKVKNVKEDKGFAPSRPQSIKDLSSTKERVKAAITREIEEKNGPRQRNTSNNINGKDLMATNKNEQEMRERSANKNLYDPDAEKIEEDSKKKMELKKKQARKAMPPPMDFQALLKLAEKKQYEPIEIPVQPKKKEPERLLTLKEKKELEERKRAKEERERKNREHLERTDKGNHKISKEQNVAHKDGISNNLGRIPKLNQTSNKINMAAAVASLPAAPTKSSTTKINRNENSKINHNTLGKMGQGVVKKTSSLPTVSKPPTVPITPANKTNTAAKVTSKMTTSSSVAHQNNQVKNQHINGSCKIREFPPRDIVKKQNMKEASSVRNNHVMPSNNMKKSKQFDGGNQKSTNNQLKRRILDDDDNYDESEYDSEMDDFIDDGDGEEDYSSHIKAIFGYDKSKYCNIDDDDDAAMESSFAQVQREEFISKKIGIKEDLEDMKLEAIEKKRKMMMKKQRLH